MLPLPSSSSRRPRTYFPSLPPNHNISSSQQTLQILRSRTRLTNLAVALLFLALSGSILLNLNYLFSGPSSSSSASRHNTQSRGRLKSHGQGISAQVQSHLELQKGWDDSATPAQLDSGIPLSIETTVERDVRYGELDHLIMVPGHAIWTGHDPDKIREDDDWVLEAMQRGGSVKTYVKHIERGVEELKADPKALLVFSGGATRPPPSPPLSEAVSYHNLAHALSLLPSTPLPPSSASAASTSDQINTKGQSSPLPLNLRAATEEYAMDSYQNLLFSIARFKEVTGVYPGRITVVGYGMKRRRFTNLHRAALNFPLSQFTYIGIDDEGDTSAHYAGELKYGFTPFVHSPSGCHPPLSIKRLVRNPFKRYHPYHISCPELWDLFEWCPDLGARSGKTKGGKNSGGGSDQVEKVMGEDEEGIKFPGTLPWTEGYDPLDSGNQGTVWDRERD
ncbi:cytoplasmic protein [Kwoniella heveanensis CBS 569]|uniref:CND01450 n=1 Tax=Kwoniella heveanensis TaxID=89924 RepID=D2KCD0_9TREE|nr:CND01450 [Kwoniella heveanensis]OCF41160.1 cytoplasmic protein [Kwoniella heveanensis CBS 569]